MKEAVDNREHSALETTLQRYSMLMRYMMKKQQTLSDFSEIRSLS